MRKKDETKFDHSVPCRHKPVTRRDFLARGLLTGVTYVTVPSVLSQLFQSTARAEMNGWVFVQINCAGGPSIHGNFLPLMPSGDLPSSNMLSTNAGVSNPSTAAINRDYDVPSLTTISQMYVGMEDIFRGRFPAGRTDISTQIKPRVQAATIVTNSGNDRSSNPIAVGEALVRAGMVGSLSGILGNNQSATGIRQANALASSTIRATFAGSVTDIQNAAKFTNAFTSLPENGLEAMANSIKRLSENQLRRLSQLSDNEVISRVALASLSKNADLVKNRPLVDARQVALYQRLFGLTAPAADGTGGTLVNNADAVIASLVKGAMDGHFGVAGFDIGGCDYHNQSLANTEAKDLEIGRRVGQVLRAAFESGKKAIVFLSSDGTNFGPRSTTNAWNGADRGELLTTWQLFIMDPTLPAGNPKRALVRSIPQIGVLSEGYNSNQQTNPLHYAVNSSGAHRGAAAVVLNAIHLMNGGDTRIFDSLFSNVFTREQKSSLLIWDPRRS